MSFWKSPAFVASAVVGLALASTLVVLANVGWASFGGCTGDHPGVEASPIHMDDERIGYDVAAGTALIACINVGDVIVDTHDRSVVRIEIERENSDTEFWVATDGDGIHILQAPEERRFGLFGGDSSDVVVRVFVPVDHAMRYDMAADVGSLSLSNAVGLGAQRWNVDVGGIDLQFSNVVSGSLRVNVDVGDASVSSSGANGWGLDAATDVGDVVITAPGFQLESRRADPPSESVTGSTPGSPSISLRVRVDVGDIRLG